MSIGIEKLKEVKELEASVINEIAAIVQKKKEGKKIGGLVALRFVDELFKTGKLIAQYEQIAAELKDLDDSEQKELIETFNTALDIEMDNVEEFAKQVNEFSFAAAKFARFCVENIK